MLNRLAMYGKELPKPRFITILIRVSTLFFVAAVLVWILHQSMIVLHIKTPNRSFDAVILYPLTCVQMLPHVAELPSTRQDAYHEQYLRLSPDGITLTASPGKSLPSWLPSEDCQYNRNRIINLAPYLRGEPIQALSLKTYERGWWKLVPNSHETMLRAILSLVMSGSVVFVFWLCLTRWTDFPPRLMALFSASLALCLLYIHKTPYFVRSYDYEGHVEYIRYIANHYALPNPSTGWELHQAPLYYIVAAPLYKIASLMGVNPTLPLQYLSLAFFFVFLYFGLLILCQSFPKPENKKYLLLAGALLLFWPSGIIHSARISNDILMYALFTGSVYYLLRWHEQSKASHFNLAILFAAAATLTKISAVILFAIIGIIWLLHIKNRDGTPKERRQQAIILAGVIIVTLFVTIGRNIYFAEPHQHDWLLLGGNALSSGLGVDNHIRNYTYFDIPNFLNRPFTNTWIDSGGRQYFWNFLFKTALFGEWDYLRPGDSYHALATIFLGLTATRLFFVMLLYSFIGLLAFKWRRDAVIVMASSLLLLSVLYYRMSHPFSCNGDFRFMYPAIIVLCLASVYGLMWLEKKRRAVMAEIGRSVIILFIGAAFIFFVTL